MLAPPTSAAAPTPAAVAVASPPPSPSGERPSERADAVVAEICPAARQLPTAYTVHTHTHTDGRLAWARAAAAILDRTCGTLLLRRLTPAAES